MCWVNPLLHFKYASWVRSVLIPDQCVLAFNNQNPSNNDNAGIHLIWFIIDSAVEHADNLTYNLLSVGQICDNKCKVVFTKNESKIIKDDKVIGKGIRKGGIYVMKLENKPKDKICLTTIDDNSTRWHRRLGHANMRLI